MLDPWEMHLTEFPLEHGFLLKALYCLRWKMTMKNELGCSDEAFIRLRDLLRNGHKHYMKIIFDFFAEFA